MKKMFSKKGMIGVALVVVVIISIIGINAYQKQETQKKIDKSISEITQVEKDFSDSENREDKLKILENLIKSYEEYKSSKAPYSEVLESYEKGISTLKKFFKEDYDKTIKDNTIEDVASNENKEDITKAKDYLSSLLDTIKSESQFTLTDDELKSYEENISTILTAYEERIKAIEEAVAQAEIESKREQQNTTNQNEQSGNVSQSQQNNSSTPSGNVSNNGGATSGSNNYVVTLDGVDYVIPPNLRDGRPIKLIVLPDDNGNYVTWLDRTTLDVYDLNGNYLFNTNTSFVH